MKKYFLSATITLSIFLLTGCFGEQSEYSINAEIHQKCRGGNMEFLDTFECVNLTIDKLKVIQKSDFDSRRDDIKSCIGEKNISELIAINEIDIELVEKSRPSIWSHYIPFVSPKNSAQSRMMELKGSDETIKSNKNRKALIDNLQDSQKNCLLEKGINSLELIMRNF